MSKLKYKIERSTVMAALSSAIVLADEDPRAALVQDALTAISTDVNITAGGVTLHLAAWQDPDHWSQEWAEALGEDADVESFIAGLVTKDQA